MLNNTIALIAFQEQDNLGVGYITSLLLDTGFSVKIIDFRMDKKEIVRILYEINPFILGFSIIFQKHINKFKELI